MIEQSKNTLTAFAVSFKLVFHKLVSGFGWPKVLYGKNNLIDIQQKTTPLRSLPTRALPNHCYWIAIVNVLI